jgi:hypothetical protein
MTIFLLRNIILIWILFPLITSGLTIYNPVTEFQLQLESYQFEWFGKRPPFNVTAELVLADPQDACKNLENAEDLVGKVVFVVWGMKHLPIF